MYKGYCHKSWNDQSWLINIRMMVIILSPLALIVGSLLTGICMGGAVSYNSGYSSDPYPGIVVGHRVEKNVCRKTTCFPGYISIDIPEIAVKNFEVRVLLNDFDSSIEKTELQLNQTWPLGTELQCYYGPSGITFELMKPLNGCTYAGFVFFGIVALGLLVLLVSELVYCIFFFRSTFQENKNAENTV